MGDLRICLFGKFHAQINGRMPHGLDTLKAQELLCYLLLNREHPYHRETLASALWGDNRTAQSKKYLRQALWQLQIALNSDSGLDQSGLLIIEPDWIIINVHMELWLDVQVFECAMSRVRGQPGEALDTDQVQCLEEAVQLYKGDLLEGWYQDWCLYERERLQNLYLEMLDKLMGHCAAHHQYEAGLEHGAKILRYDRARERTHWQLMRLHYLAGDRAGALRQYERCAAALDQELSVKPSQRTLALYEQIRADNVADFALPAHYSSQLPAHPPTQPPTLAHTLERLKSLRATLNSLQDQVDQELRAVEEILGNSY